MNKKSLFSFLIALFALLFVVSCEQGGTSTSGETETLPVKAPKIVFENTLYKGGEVIEGTKVAHAFKFVNEGKKPLDITDVRSTCGCTVAKLDKRQYEPGEGGEIQVVFNSHGYAKNVTKTVIVRTNDPLHKTVYLTIKCFVKKYIDVTPGFLNFGDVPYNDKKTVTIFLRGDVEKHFNVTKIDFPLQMKDSLSYKVTPVSGSNSVYKVDITLAPKNPDIKSFGYSMMIYTDSKHVPTIPIQIRGAITGPIQYYPQAISFYGQKNRYISYTINLMSKKYFTIRKAAFDFGESNNFGININAVKKGYIYTVTVYSKTPAQVGTHGTLTITTSLPTERRIALRVNIKVR